MAIVKSALMKLNRTEIIYGIKIQEVTGLDQDLMRRITCHGIIEQRKSFETSAKWHHLSTISVKIALVLLLCSACLREQLLSSIVNQQCCRISGHMLTKHLHSTLQWWLSATAESKSAAKKMTRRFLQIWIFLRNDLSNDLKQVIMNHNNKHRQMYRGQTKCTVIPKVNNKVLVFGRWLFYVLRVQIFFLPNCSAQYRLHTVERKLQQ